MISIAPGSSPAAITRVTASPARLQRGRRPAACDNLGARQQPQRDLERDAEQPFRADEQAGQVGPDLLQAVAAQLHDARRRRSTTSRPSTWLAVMPWLRQWAPPELKATLPPMVQTDWLEGSGA